MILLLTLQPLVQIKFLHSPRAIDDVNGVATIHKKTDDTLKITTSEKTDIQGTPDVSEMKREDTDMRAEFLAKEYGHDPNLWFMVR